MIDVLTNIGELYEIQSNKKTVEFYKKAMYLAKDINARKKLYNLYIIISEYYEREEEYKRALLYYKRYFSINEEIMNENIKNKLEVLNIGIRNVKGKNKINNVIDSLEKEIKRQSYELEKTKTSNKILEEKVYKDELTGIENRRSINKYLSTLLEGENLDKENILLFMIDIDKFKRYNDYWGHSQGDACIKKITNCIKKIQIDYGDKFGRYGGEEFIYISISTNYKEAEELGNLIRTEVENLGLYYIHKNEKKYTTISLGGVIGEKKKFNSVREIIEIADKELYSAKDMGRNTTILKYID